MKPDVRFDDVLCRATLEPSPDAPPLDLARIRSICLMINEHVGIFRLELAWINAVER